MKLFLTNNDNLNQINEKPFNFEKDIQSISEFNMDKIFELEFVKSEYSLNNFRIDSLCFDKNSKSFVIIEYKNTKKFFCNRSGIFISVTYVE